MLNTTAKTTAVHFGMLSLDSNRQCFAVTVSGKHLKKYKSIVDRNRQVILEIGDTFSKKNEVYLKNKKTEKMENISEIPMQKLEQLEDFIFNLADQQHKNPTILNQGLTPLKEAISQVYETRL